MFPFFPAQRPSHACRPMRPPHANCSMCWRRASIPRTWWYRAYEEPDGRWPLALYFRDPPDEAAVRSLVALAAGTEAADLLMFETMAPNDWVRKSLDGLSRSRPAALSSMGRTTAPAYNPTASVSKSRPGWLSAPAITPPRADASWRSTGSSSSGRRGRTLDIGTGTGVLAIAAVKALRQPALASDIDLRAVRTARENARLQPGRCPDRDRAHRGPARPPVPGARTVRDRVRQYPAGAAQAARGAPRAPRRPGRNIVLSGLLEAQARPRARRLPAARPRLSRAAFRWMAGSRSCWSARPTKRVARPSSCSRVKSATIRVSCGAR